MPTDLDDVLLPKDDYLLPRTPKVLRDWVLAKCSSFRDVPESKEPVLLHEGRFKPFHEELFPLSVFAIWRYGDRGDVICTPNLDDRLDFDARIQEPGRTVRIEITVAGHDHDQHLRMVYFLERGVVSFSGPVTVDGTKRKGRRIEVHPEAHEHTELRERHLRWIREAAMRKAGPGRYGKGYELVIAVEDWWFTAGDVVEASNFIRRKVMTLPLPFDAIHIAGYMEKMRLSFERGGE